MIGLITDYSTSSTLALTPADIARARELLRTIDPQTAHRLVSLLRESEIVGNLKLLRTLFVLVYDAAVTVAPSDETNVGPIESAPITSTGTHHAFYIASAYTPVAGKYVIYYGSSITISVGNISVAITRKYATSPVRYETYAHIYNAHNVAISVQLKIYRVAGLV